MSKDDLVYECFIMRQYDPDFIRQDENKYFAKLQSMSKIALEEHILFLESEKMHDNVVA